MSVKKAVGLAGFYLFAERLHRRFVAGDGIEDAVRRAKFYKERGEKSVINILGEHVRDPDEAVRARDQIIELMVLLGKEGLTDVHVAEKPSHIGLDISENLYFDNKARILSAAQIYLPDALVETDAEDHSYHEKVFKITFWLSKAFQNQMLALQLNRNDALREIKILNVLGIPYRLCKGNAYAGDIESEKELRRVFLESAILAAKHGERPAFATHDLFLIDRIARDFPEEKDKFEFELLMGIEENLCKELRFQGFAFRRYIPCGPNWRPYGKRRAEAVVNTVLRNFWYRIAERRR